MTELILNPKRPRHIQVQTWYYLNPYLRRIVFHSPDLADYPFQCHGAHIKILLPLPHQNQPTLPEYTTQGPRWADNAEKPFSRTYTLQNYNRTACTLTIDFVLHGDNGPTSYFAHHVQIGQTIGISPPMGPNPMLKPAQDYLFIGDLSALPAISAMLADMSDTTQGTVLLHLPDKTVQPPTFNTNALIKLHCFYGIPHEYDSLLEQVKQSYPQHPEHCFIWLAGEANMVTTLRQLVRKEWHIPAVQCYAIPYWHMGEAEESYHAKRHDFIDSNPL